MNPHVRSALWAALLTAVAALGLIALVDTVVQRWLDPVLTAPVLPGFYVATYLGLRGGPDGVPHLAYVYALTFLLWWAVIDLGQAVWRWVRAA